MPRGVREGVGRTLLVVVCGLTVAPGGLAAQLAVQAVVRPAVAVPIGAFAGREEGVDAGAGLGYDAGASVTVGALTVYGEYQQMRFGCGECAEAGLEDEVRDRGWGAGVQIPVGSAWPGIRPWVRLGVIGHHLRFRSSDDDAAYSDDALGWVAGIGGETRPLPWLRLEPTLLLRRYAARFRFGIDVPDRSTAVSYLSVGVGVGVGR